MRKHLFALFNILHGLLFLPFFFYWLDTFNATIFNFTDFFFSHMFRFYWVSLMGFYFIYCISQLQNFYLVLLIFFFSINQASRKFPNKD